MSRILIAYESDTNTRALRDALTSAGHSVWLDFEVLRGVEAEHLHQTYLEKLSQFDVHIAVFVPFETHSVVRQEHRSAMSVSAANATLLPLAVFANGREIDGDAEGALTFVSTASNLLDIVPDVLSVITDYEVHLPDRQQGAAQASVVFEKDASDYIQEAIEFQRTRERRDRVWANFWYFMGFLSLLSAAVFVALGVLGFLPGPSGISNGKFDVEVATYYTLKYLVVTAILSACARFAFTLGKGFGSESIKSSDRIHAVQFGRFYIRAYGQQAKWAELKEVFAHWNIDRASVVSSQDASSFDPKIMESVADLLRAATAKEKARGKKARAQ